MDKQTIKAVIFDMDGVISDTQVIHAKVESEILKEYGIEIHPDEITNRFAGVAISEIFQEIFSDFNKEMPAIEELIKTKWETMERLAKNNVKEIPGTGEFIQSLKILGLPIAVASASRLAFIKLILSELNLIEKFNVISSAEEVKRGKPEPDLFLLAAERLGILPKDCLVIEDGISGMIAAKKAGMKCIGLVRHEESKNYPADFLVKDLRDVPTELFKL